MKLNIALLGLFISVNGFSASKLVTNSDPADVQDSAYVRRQAINADKQGMSKADTAVTRQVRQAIMQDKSLSTEAQNIKVITIDGKVTLKGTVKSNQEVNSIVDKAHGVAGVNHVSNQIEVINK